MLWVIATILMVLWILGLATSYMAGGFIHIFVVLALIMVTIKIVQDRLLDT